LFKLKQGWRYRYGDSPQRTLLALRMQRAKLLLENGCQVAQAAGKRATAIRPISAPPLRATLATPKTVARAGPEKPV
jgi:AraC-like DNA-binding protein